MRFEKPFLYVLHLGAPLPPPGLGLLVLCCPRVGAGAGLEAGRQLVPGAGAGRAEDHHVSGLQVSDDKPGSVLCTRLLLPLW